MITIKVNCRSEDFVAIINGNPGLWACGRTPIAALGEALVTHADKLGIDIEFPNVDDTIKVLKNQER